MTKGAVEKFVGKAVLSDKFRENLNARQMSREEISAVDPDLDVQDVNAIVFALLNTPGDFPSFSVEIGKYIDLCYRGACPSAGPSAGDDFRSPSKTD